MVGRYYLQAGRITFEGTDDYNVFTFHVRPIFDFQQVLLSLGDDTEVLSPSWLRNEIANKIMRMWNKYNVE